MGRIQPGQRFGKWKTVESVRVTSRSGRINTKWSVVCDCGEENTVFGHDLNVGKSTQCKKCYGTATKDLEGRRFGQWTVLKPAPKKNGKTHWHCLCDCGTLENVCSASLTKGVSKKCIQCSCSCRETHGYSYHPLYPTWSAMIARCKNPSSVSYADYGGRGINVCDRWEQIENFIEDMSPRPKGMTLDRINNELGYSNDNCRWATWKEQANNRRKRKIR